MLLHFEPSPALGGLPEPVERGEIVGSVLSLNGSDMCACCAGRTAWNDLPEEEQALLALLAADGGASRLGQRDSALLRIFLDERLDSPRMPDLPGGASPGGRQQPSPQPVSAAASSGAHPAGNGPAGGPSDAFLQPGKQLPAPAPAAL